MGYFCLRLYFNFFFTIWIVVAFFSHLDSQRFGVSHQSPLWVFDISWKSFPNPPPPISFPLLPPNDNWHRRKCRKKSESNSIHFSNSISCAEEFELEENIYLHFQQKKRHSSPVYKYNGCSNWFDIQELFFSNERSFYLFSGFSPFPSLEGGRWWGVWLESIKAASTEHRL